MPEDVKEKVAALVEALYASELGTVRSIHVDLQDSGEHPFRVVVAEEELPVPGVAKTAPPS